MHNYCDRCERVFSRLEWGSDCPRCPLEVEAAPVGTWQEKTIVELQRRARRRLVHGSEAREVMLEQGCPGALVEPHCAEQILETALEPLVAMGRCPTHAQRLLMIDEHNRKERYVPGIKETYYFRSKL